MRLTTAGLALAFHAVAVAAAPGGDELERWFQSDELAVPGASVEHVNGGELTFLETAPTRRVHHHENRLEIPASSLRDGWVKVMQCHANIDPVERLQIVFRDGRVRDLTVRSSKNIAQVSVDGPSVQLRGVRHAARLCLAAWTRALRSNEDGSFTLRSGPFMRKFLDGYYPMRVSMDVDYSQAGLDVVGVSPPAQAGFDVVRRPGGLGYDTWFEGRLVTEITFRRTVP